MDDVIWSGTDFPYMCLIDINRTLAFQKAIKEVVKNGDVVVDIGSGTGILAMFAASAGASKVYAVELDHLLAGSLRRTVALNNLQDQIEIVEGDALNVELPQNVNVVVAELIETGLLDEMQVKVLNELRDKGVIGSDTKIVPSVYETFVQLLEIDNTFYGYKIAAPIHDWPFYSLNADEWHQLNKKYLAEPQSLGRFDFAAGPVNPVVNKTLQFQVPAGQTVNALEISGDSQLSPSVQLGPAHSYNGNKILSIEPVIGPVNLSINFDYKMSQGLGSFKFSVQQ